MWFSPDDFRRFTGEKLVRGKDLSGGRGPPPPVPLWEKFRVSHRNGIFIFPSRDREELPGHFPRPEVSFIWRAKRAIEASVRATIVPPRYAGSTKPSQIKMATILELNMDMTEWDRNESSKVSSTERVN
jgi:hypothetical protein